MIKEKNKSTSCGGKQKIPNTKRYFLWDCLRSMSTRTNAIIASAVPICAVLKKTSKLIALSIY
jgi:hypothetical protein